LAIYSLKFCFVTEVLITIFLFDVTLWPSNF